jgi:IMP cyclohydrolase
MKPISLEKEISSVTYPGRGIVIGRSADGTKAVIAYFIMGRSENSRNRIFVETEDGIKTQAFDESKLIDRQAQTLLYGVIPQKFHPRS